MWALLLFTAFLLAGSQASVPTGRPGVLKRAVADSPTGGYAPGTADCPSERPRVRVPSSLSREEANWLQTRRNNTIEPLRELLGRLRISGFDAPAFIQANRNNASALPNVAIAASGGGYRALMNGAGAIAAFDSRTPNSTSPGHLGGLLQSATYLAGLSGGAWLVGSIYVNNFTTIQALQAPNAPTWNFERSILEGPSRGGLSITNTVDYFKKIQTAVASKASTGFNTSITDYWGRALSYQLINSSDGGPGVTWSSISRDDEFAAGRAPMPIVVADGRAPGEFLIPINTTVFEFTPFEFGSFDRTLYGFIPLRYLGTNFSAGVVLSNETCVRGFDNAGFVMGTSSSLFNQVLLQIGTQNLPTLVKETVAGILQGLNESNNDIADYRPNPFYLWNNDTNLSARSRSLTLVDGGEDLQNIPLHPLIEPQRQVDVIFAVDSSADTEFAWPNGTAMVATYTRSVSAIDNRSAFPAVPDTNTFVNLGLNTRPTFFGCDARNQSGPTPLIVYLPNSPYVYQSNVSTFTLSHNRSARDAIITNGYHAVTLANATVDAEWPACVGCAILSRSLERTNTPVPEVCRSCFRRYCWDGTRNSSTPAQYNPTTRLPPIRVQTSGALSSLAAHPSTFLSLACAILFLLVSC